MDSSLHGITPLRQRMIDDMWDVFNGRMRILRDPSSLWDGGKHAMHRIHRMQHRLALRDAAR